MYTQCPDCNTAFRVTAEVLRQAAGKVRCGGCSSAFNALEFLSEEMPEQLPAAISGQTAPELTAEPVDENAGLPKSISAEQSAALLKTLDQLAGSDIRIEDTGVEWRVLDEHDVADNAEHFDAETLDDASNIDGRSDTSADDSADEFTSTSVDQLRFDDNTPLPDDFEFDDAEPYAPLASNEDEAVAAESVAVVVEPTPDIALSEPDEWEDILGEFTESADEMSEPVKPELAESTDNAAVVDDVSDIDDAAAANDVPDAAGDSDDVLAEHDNPQDIDTQFGLQAEAMGIDLSGMHELDEVAFDDEAVEEALVDEELVDEELALQDENGMPDDSPEPLADTLPDDDFNAEAARLAISELQQEPLVEHHTIEDELAALRELDQDEEILDEEIQYDGVAEVSLAQDGGYETSDEDSFEQAHDRAADDEDLPPQTEDEQTINRMIDQDLMALAIEDEDGFASTIIFPEDAAKRVWQQGQSDTATHAIPDTTGFESIVMEGDTARSEDDDEKFAPDSAAAAELASAIRELPSESESQSGGVRRGIIAACIVLVLLLGVQVVHQSREALATIPAFNNTVGPIYRAFGKPLQPEWDITGWRFEATKGSANSQVEAAQFDGVGPADEELTIYSRIGNKSQQPLPYPLIGISLTDRFEETIGSRILDPAEYLSNDLDPRKLVRPGNSFNAVISIQSPSENATGFKLNVCYRLSDGQLRCAIDDFK